MAVKVNVKRTFKIDGKEYGSVDEMPEGVREAVRNAMALRTDLGRGSGPAGTHTTIVFNGMEYASIDAMPRDVRRLYETVLDATEADAAVPGVEPSEMGRGLPRQPEPARTARPGDIPPATQFESAFSSRAIMVSILLIALLLLLYYLWQLR